MDLDLPWNPARLEPGRWDTSAKLAYRRHVDNCIYSGATGLSGSFPPSPTFDIFGTLPDSVEDELDGATAGAVMDQFIRLPPEGARDAFELHYKIQSTPTESLGLVLRVLARKREAVGPRDPSRLDVQRWGNRGRSD